MQDTIGTLEKVWQTAATFAVAYSFQILGALLILAVGLKLAAWLGGIGAASITETTADFNVNKAAADGKRLQWLTLGGDGAGEPETKTAPRVGDSAPVAAFEDEFLRSYVITV